MMLSKLRTTIPFVLENSSFTPNGTSTYDVYVLKYSHVTVYDSDTCVSYSFDLYNSEPEKVWIIAHCIFQLSGACILSEEDTYYERVIRNKYK